MRLAWLALAGLALVACEQKRMTPSPEKKAIPKIPYEAYYPEPKGEQLRPVRMNAGEVQWVPLDHGIKMSRWDEGALAVTPGDGGVTLKALRAGGAIVEGVDERGLAVQLPVEIFPPLKTQK